MCTTASAVHSSTLTTTPGDRWSAGRKLFFVTRNAAATARSSAAGLNRTSITMGGRWSVERARYFITRTASSAERTTVVLLLYVQVLLYQVHGRMGDRWPAERTLCVCVFFASCCA